MLAAALLAGTAHAGDLPLLQLDRATGRIYSAADPEVRLFGVNYLGAGYQYFSVYKGRPPRPQQPLSRPLFHDLGVRDIKSEVIDRDLDDMQAMGINVLRIHILMSDIALRGGALRDNSLELDAFDYLLAGAIRRGIYIYLTPITPWDTYYALPNRFSGQDWQSATYTVDPAVIDAEAAFIANLLRHRNPYLDDGKGRPYGAEPGIALIGLMNEPAYLNDPSGRYDAPPYDEAWLRDHLIDRLAGAVRDGEAIPGGVHHLIGWNLHGWDETVTAPIAGKAAANPNLVPALRASAVDVLELSGYTLEGYWQTYPYAADPAVEPRFRMAGIAQRPPLALDAPNARRADVVYEWDAPGSQKAYVYPNIAAQMRLQNIQIAAQFQYDMQVEANTNSVWPRHYLNRFYTPERTVAFMIAARTFRDGALGQPFADGDTVRTGATTTSFSADIAVYADATTLMYSRSIPADLTPAIPATLRDVTGVGTSPVVRFDGSGAYSLRRIDDASGWHLELTLNPDVDIRTRTYRIAGSAVVSTVTGDPSCYCGLDPTRSGDTRTLAARTHSLTLTWPGLSSFRIEQRQNDHATTIGTFTASDTLSLPAGTVTGTHPAVAGQTVFEIYPE